MTQFAHDSVKPYQGSESSKKQQVAEMFNSIAFRYDFMNRFLSGGIDIYWRKKALSQLKALQPKSILDVATGTGDFALLANRMLHPDKITGVDISEGMLDFGKKKVTKNHLGNKIELLVGDSENLPFPENTFDAITVAFGVRNFQNLENGLSEMHRVLKPKGKLVVLEFSQPKKKLVKGLFNFYTNKITPGIGKMVTQNREAYQYLTDSVLAFPERENFVTIMNKTGYHNTNFKPLTMGICCIYTGIK